MMEIAIPGRAPVPKRRDRVRALRPPRRDPDREQERVQRLLRAAAPTRPMTIASELVWELVPPLVLAADDFVLAALLEPCYDIGGDAFDYALNGGVLHFAVFDAMGHGLAAAGVAAGRSRRTGTAAATAPRARGGLRWRSTRAVEQSTRQPLRDRADRRARSLHRRSCMGQRRPPRAAAAARRAVHQGTRCRAVPTARHSARRGRSRRGPRIAASPATWCCSTPTD